MGLFNLFSKQDKNTEVFQGEITRKYISELLSEVLDPEIGIDIVSSGLIYDIDIDDKTISIEMTMTTPSCPMSSLLVDNSKDIIKKNIPGTKVKIKLVWDPVWNTEMMSESAKKIMGW